MNVVTFNVNSIRMRTHQLVALINKYQPDVVGLQETKVQDSEFPTELINSLGYHVVFHGQKTHYGVALLTKRPLKRVKKGFDLDDTDAQCRFIMGELTSPTLGSITIMNGYFPQGGSRDHPTKFSNKKLFYRRLNDLVEQYEGKNLIVMGDMNVALSDDDVGISQDEKARWLSSGQCSFLPEEREWLTELCNKGLTDTLDIHPIDGDKRLSWFDYRSKGFEQSPKRGLRIDLILLSEQLKARCNSVAIDHGIRAMDKPSDHCPVVASLS